MWLRTIGLVLACVANSVAQQTPANVTNEQPARVLVNRVFYSVHSGFTLTDLVHFERLGRDITLKLAPSSKLTEVLSRSRAALQFDGSGALWRASSRVTRDAWNTTELPTLSLKILTHATREPVSRIESIEINSNLIQLLGRTTIESQQIQSELTIQPGSWRLQVLDVSDVSSLVVLVNETGSSGMDLLRNAPEPMVKYALPMLRALHRGKNPLLPGTSDVYSAFPLLAASPADRRRLEPLLAELKSAHPHAREQAAAQLAAADEGLVLAAMRADRATLSPEQILQLDQLQADQSTYDLSPGPALQRDPLFLFLLRDHDDYRVRTLARTLLRIRREASL